MSVTVVATREALDLAGAVTIAAEVESRSAWIVCGAPVTLNFSRMVESP